MILFNQLEYNWQLLRSFLKIVGFVALASVHYRVVGDLEMKMVSGYLFCRSESLLAATMLVYHVAHPRHTSNSL